MMYLGNEIMAEYTHRGPENLAAISETSQTILDSQVSVDAIPSTPTNSVLLGETPLCECFGNGHPDTTQTGQDIPESSLDHNRNPLQHSKTYPELCNICNKPKNNGSSASPISETHSCADLSEIHNYVEEDFHSMSAGFYDVMILYAEADRDEAITFLRHLRNDIKLSNGESIKAALYDEGELRCLSGYNLDQLEKAFERCSFTFVYLTKTFVNDVWCKLTSESCLMRTVYDRKRNWRVVPVYTKRRVEYDFSIPFGINALKGISYFENDEFYRNNVSSLIEKTLSERKQKENLLLAKRRNWTESHPGHSDSTQEQKQNGTPTMNRLTMVQPQQSLEPDGPLTPLFSGGDCSVKNQTDTCRGEENDDDSSFEITPGPSSAVAVSQCSASPDSIPTEIPAGMATTNNTAQATSSVNIDLKVHCDNTDSIQIGLGVKKTNDITTTTTKTQYSEPESNAVKTTEQRCIYQYYVEKQFCYSSKRNSQLLWSQYFCWSCDKNSSASYEAKSEDFLDPLD